MIFPAIGNPVSAGLLFDTQKHFISTLSPGESSHPDLIRLQPFPKARHSDQASKKQRFTTGRTMHKDSTITDTSPSLNNPSFVFGNHHFRPADTLFRLCIQCNGSGLFQDWYDFSSVVSQFNRPGIHWRSSGDSLYVDIFDTDAIEPFIKAGTLTTLAFHSDYFIPLCMGGTPFIAGLPEPDIIRLPKLGFKSFTNPVQDGVLKFVLLNNEVIPSLTAIQLMDISGKIVQEFHVHQLHVEHEEQKLELKGVAAGNYFLRISSESDQVAVQVLVK